MCWTPISLRPMIIWSCCPCLTSLLCSHPGVVMTFDRGGSVSARAERTDRWRERDVQCINQAWGRVTDPRDGVDSTHTGREQAVVGGVLIGVEAGFEFGIEAGLAFDHHAPHAVDAASAALRPVRCYVFCHPVDVLDRDHFLAIDHADAAEPDRCDGAGFDHPG